MIEQIHIKNFQSHGDSVFDLVPGVNAIVGDSHVGKSAVRRLLHWIRCNRPLGSSFIKSGSRRAYGRVQFDNGVVERTKAAKKSTYVLGGNPEPYTSFGSGVPEDVTELVNMSDVNVQTQHGPFFLIMDTPGSVATYLRSVTGLDELSEVSSDINTRLRSAKSRMSTVEQEVTDLHNSIDDLDEIDVTRLEECLDECVHLGARSDALEIELKSLSRIIERVEELRSVPCIPEDVADDLFKSMDYLVGQKKVLEDDSDTLDAALSKLESLSGKSIVVREGLLGEVDDVIAIYLHNVDGEEIIDGKIKQLAQMLKDAMVDDELLRDLQAEEHGLLCQLKDCPHCGTGLTEEAREKLLGETK